MEFAQSRFYKWTKGILWVVAVIGIGLSGELAHAIIWMAVALGYTIVPWLAARRVTADSVSHDEIENHKNTSPVVIYLNTLFDDISHINAVSGDSGIRFSFATVELNNYSALRLYLTADKKRVDFIQQYKDNARLWYTGVRGESVKKPEELEKELASHFCYDTGGYAAKNPSFRKELEEEFLRSSELDLLGWSYIPIEFSKIRVGHDLSRSIDVTAITECANAHGFRVSIQPRSEEYLSDTLHISF